MVVLSLPFTHISKARAATWAPKLCAWLARAGWVAGWLAGWLVGWLVGWPADWLAGWLVGWLAGWLVGGNDNGS